MKYNPKRIALAIFFLIAVMIALTLQQAMSQDTAKVSLSGMDQQIAQRTQGLQTLMQQIEQAKQDAVYLQGALDMLKDQRRTYTPKPDTAKVEQKGKAKK
jgi:hypothetical protein